MREGPGTYDYSLPDLVKANGCRVSFSQRSISNGQIFAEFVTVQFNAPVIGALVARDIPVRFRNPYRFFWVASINNVLHNNAVMLHFFPLAQSLQIGGANSITPAGSEAWIPFANSSDMVLTNVSPEGRWIHSKEPLQTIYLDIPAAALNPFITIGASNDIHSFCGCRV